MKIKSVQLWFPGQNNPTVYNIDGTIRHEGKLQKIYGIELSPTGEVLILREDGGATVWGYVPYQLTCVQGGEAGEKDNTGDGIPT